MTIRQFFDTDCLIIVDTFHPLPQSLYLNLNLISEPQRCPQVHLCLFLWYNQGFSCSCLSPLPFPYWQYWVPIVRPDMWNSWNLAWGLQLWFHAYFLNALCYLSLSFCSFLGILEQILSSKSTISLGLTYTLWIANPSSIRSWS
jgi:hypothetical protein